MHTQLHRSHSSVELTSTKARSKIPADVIDWLVLAIYNNDLDTFVKNLQRYPDLLNYPLNVQKQTVLMVAIFCDANAITQFLLKVGANRQLTDSNQDNAVDYAKAKGNMILVKQLNTPAVFPPLFAHLKKAILAALDKQAFNTQIIHVLTLVLAQLDKLDYASISNHTIARQFDLYFTAQGIINALHQAHDDESLDGNLRDFFAVREQVLCGEDQDHGDSNTLANQLCRQIAQYFWPRSTIVAASRHASNRGGIFHVMSHFLQPLSTTSLTQLDYAFFANHQQHMFNADFTAQDVIYLDQPADLRLLELIYYNPELISSHPKLSLFAAILFQHLNKPDNAFFTEFNQHCCLKPSISKAVQMILHVLHPDVQGEKPPWLMALMTLSADFYNALLLALADKEHWEPVWKLLNIDVPAATVMEELLLKTLHQREIEAFAHFRSIACETNGIAYRKAIIHYWKKAIKQPALLIPRTSWITHIDFPELENLFLLAKTQVEWNSVLIYVKSAHWVYFSEALTLNLFKNALTFNVYVAAELLTLLKPRFSHKTSPQDKPLVLGLLDYCEKRLNEKTSSGYFWYSLWGRLQGMNEQIKLSAAIKKILSLRCDSIEFTEKEDQALNNARLGRIVWWNTPANSLPPASRPRTLMR
jgi:hypothetical protein